MKTSSRALGSQESSHVEGGRTALTGIENICDGEDKADRGKGGKTTSRNGQTWSSPSPRTGENGENWL